MKQEYRYLIPDVDEYKEGDYVISKDDDNKLPLFKPSNNKGWILTNLRQPVKESDFVIGVRTWTPAPPPTRPKYRKLRGNERIRYGDRYISSGLHTMATATDPGWNSFVRNVDDTAIGQKVSTYQSLDWYRYNW